MFNSIVTVICVIAIIISIYSAIKIFNDKRIPKKKRTRRAYMELAFAIAIILSFSNNPFLIIIGFVLIMVAFSGTIRAFFRTRRQVKNMMNRSQQINEMLKKNPDIKNDIDQIIAKSRANHDDLSTVERAIREKIREMENRSDKN